MPKYKLYTYDVWGNTKEGFWVNDIHAAMRGTSILNAENVIIELKGNETDYQINRKLGLRGIIWTDQWAEEDYMYGNLKRNGKPIGELRLISEG